MQLCSSLNIFGGGLVAKSCPALVTSWTVVCQAPLSMGFSREEYWNGLPSPPPGDLPEPRIEPGSLAAPALQVDSLLLSHGGTSMCCLGIIKLMKTPYKGRVSRPA